MNWLLQVAWLDPRIQTDQVPGAGVVLGYREELHGVEAVIRELPSGRLVQVPPPWCSVVGAIDIDAVQGPPPPSPHNAEPTRVLQLDAPAAPTAPE